MRSQIQLRHTRTRVRPRYALLPLEGYPPSSLPFWTGAEIRVLTSPAMGAGFVQYLIDLQPGGGTKTTADHSTETFMFVLAGKIDLQISGEQTATLGEGGFALVPHTHDYVLQAAEGSSMIMLRKRFEAVAGLETPPPLTGNQAQVPANIWMNIDGARLQTLIPDDIRYDLAMNIFTFQPGFSLPVVETHVMEHGLYFMRGKGLYFLDEEWMEVEAGDFIWMGPYVPQSFYATGPEASQYLYYKNVNRDIPL